MSKTDSFEHGMSVRCHVLGDDYVSAALSHDDFNKPLQKWITEAIWSEVWGNQQMPLKTRSLITIAFLITLNRETELELHFRAAINNGCTLTEVREVILQAAAYCGAPAAVSAMRIANKTLANEISAVHIK